MWPFNTREKVDDTIPPEVQEYYETERRERRGMAWLLAFTTLVVTVLLAVGIFFGARWVYRQITDGESPQISENEGDQSSEESGGQGSQAPEGDQEQQPSTQQQGQPSGGQTPAQTPSTQPQQPSTPQETGQGTGQTQPQTLTSTGPTETVAAFIGVTVLATVAHQIYTRLKLNRDQS